MPAAWNLLPSVVREVCGVDSIEWSARSTITVRGQSPSSFWRVTKRRICSSARRTAASYSVPAPVAWPELSIAGKFTKVRLGRTPPPVKVRPSPGTPCSTVRSTSSMTVESRIAYSSKARLSTRLQ